MSLLVASNASMQRLRWFTSGVVVATLIVMLFGYVSHAANPIIQSDNWHYTADVVEAYLDGHLNIVDFFTKRAPADNAQQLNRLILIGLVQWFQMDFSVQGIFGAIIAVVCVGLLSWFALRERPAVGQPAWQRPMFTMLLAAVILSLNAYGDYNWPQVTTLIYTGTLGISIYLYFAATLSSRGAWWQLALLTFLLLVLFDTFATLAVLSAVLLIIMRIPGSSRKRQLLAGATTSAVTLMLYQRLFFWLTGMADSPLQAGTLLSALRYTQQHIGQAWKVLVAPFGGAIYAPPIWLHNSWPTLCALAVPMWFLNAWFWRIQLRERGDRIAFLAGGLMLYSYATTAGMLVSRVPHDGFDYLLEPRYIAFYQLQLVAILLLWSRTSAPNIRGLLYFNLVAAACIVLLVFDVYATTVVWKEIPSQLKYHWTMVAQINALARDPANPPSNCQPETKACQWPEEQRRRVLNILERYKLNVFSPKMRQRHGYEWEELPPSPP